MDAQHANLLIEIVNGKARTEPVHVLPLPSGSFRILHSPGFVQGVAAGDEIAFEGGDGGFQVLSRGGNLAVQVFASVDMTPQLSELSELAIGLGGCLDGNISRGAVLTVPVTATFPVIEAALNAFVARHPGHEWFYGNVYSPADGVTPLRWWEHA